MLKKYVFFVFIFLFFSNSVSAILDNYDIPNDSNAISYDQRLSSIENRGGFIWADIIYSDQQIKTIQQKTIRDAWIAHNISYSATKYKKGDNSYIIPILNRALLNYSIGNNGKSFHYFLEAKQVMDSMRQKGFSLGKEQSKIFKGEPYEQGMACLYMGILLYEKKDFNNARAMFAQSLELDRESIPSKEQLEKKSKKYSNKSLSEQEVMDIFQSLGNDNRFAYYMLAKTFMKLEDDQNVRIGLENSNNWIKIPDFVKENSCGIFKSKIDLYDRPPLTTDNSFNTIKHLEEDNLFLLIEMGFAPQKQLGGLQGNKDFLSPRQYPERKAKVYMDGKYLCESQPMLNLTHQAAAIPRTEKDSAQTGKALTKSICAFLAFASDQFVDANLYETVQNNWSVAADTRIWGTLPNDIHIASAKVEPGIHTITVFFLDESGNNLSHYEQTVHYIPINENEESFVRIRSLRDKCNTIRDFYASKVKKVDTGKNSLLFNPNDLTDLSTGSSLDIFTIDLGSDAANKQYLKDRILTKNYKISKIGQAKVIEINGKKATAQITEGICDERQTYFVTNYNLPLLDITEVSNFSMVNND